MARVFVGALLIGSAVAGCGRVGFDDVDADARSARDGAALGDALIGVNVVFATSTQHAPGSFGDLAGADAICEARATEAGLSGTYVAWLSTAAAAAPSRLAGARGWVRPDGRPVFDTVADIVAGIMWYPIDLDEQARPLREAPTISMVVTTGTSMTGTYTGSDCAGYASTAATVGGGRAGMGTRSWTEGVFNSCATPSRLYCFGIDHATPVSPDPGSVRRAFLVSTASFAHDARISAADAVCQGEATSAALSGTYRALIARPGIPPIVRFDTTGAPWARVDGVLLADTAEGFAAGQFLAPLEVTAGGTRPLPTLLVTTGATSPSSPGSSASTCLDWTSAASTDTRGIAQANAVELFSTSTSSCINQGQLYCLQP